MKREMNHLRELLIKIESLGNQDLVLDLPYENDHLVWMLKNAELIGWNAASIRDQKRVYIGCKLTWMGHEFVDNARGDEIWKAVHDNLERAGVPSVSFSLLGELLESEIKKRLNN